MTKPCGHFYALPFLRSQEQLPGSYGFVPVRFSFIQSISMPHPCSGTWAGRTPSRGNPRPLCRTFTVLTGGIHLTTGFTSHCLPKRLPRGGVASLQCHQWLPVAPNHFFKLFQLSAHSTRPYTWADFTTLEVLLKFCRTFPSLNLHCNVGSRCH